jgi:hypothetical protein
VSLTVRERGDVVSTFRWIEVRLMELLAAWVPTTPEMEVKLLFGTHIWDAAQHADAFGKRTHELRLPLQHSLEPVDAYVELLAQLAATTETAKRIGGFYDVVLPDLRHRFTIYLDRVDALLDAPTVRIIERVMFDMDRMLRDRQSLLEERPDLAGTDPGWLEGLGGRFSAIADVVQYRPERSTVSEPA